MSAVTERERQVQEALTTRERQIEDAERLDAWLQEFRNGRTHHGYGVCVKEHKAMCACEPENPSDWSNVVCKCGFEHVREGFWEDAKHIASEHDFDVTSAGRQGGWLVVSREPPMDDWWEEEQRAWLERFAAFALEIQELHENTREAYMRGEHLSGEKLADMMADIYGED